MADRVYPTAKPNPPPPATGGGAAAVSFPAPKSQMYQRPIYRPQAPAKRRRGRCSFCRCLCWSLLVVILLALLAAAAGGVFYILYRPQRPSFAVSSVRLASLNLTTTTASPALITSSITLTVTARNPNKKLAYLYDDLALSAATAGGVPLGAATVPGFAHQPGNTTVLSATLAADSLTVDPSASTADIKRSGGGSSFSVVVDAETRAGVRVGRFKTKRIGIQVRCQSIKVTPPKKPAAAVSKKLTADSVSKGEKNNSTALLAPAPAPSSSDNGDTPAAGGAATVSAAAHACTVRVRVKIWRWTF